MEEQSIIKIKRLKEEIKNEEENLKRIKISKGHKCCSKCHELMDFPTVVKKWNGATNCHEYNKTWEMCEECERKVIRTC